MKDKVVLHQYVLFGVLILLILFKFVSGNFVFGLDLLWWLLGAIIGFLFVFCDKYFLDFLMKPEETLSIKIKELFDSKKISEGLLSLLSERYNQKELVMRSFLFLVVYLIMALLAVTSVSGSFGRGFILGIGIHLLFDLIFDYFWDKERFNLWFWQIKREVNLEEKRWFVILAVIIFGMLALNF